MSKKRPSNVRVTTRTPIETQEEEREFKLLEFLSEVFLRASRYLRTEWYRTLELYTLLYTARYARLRRWVEWKRAPKVNNHRINLAHPQVTQKRGNTSPRPKMSRWQRASSKVQEMILKIRTSPRWTALQKKAKKRIPEIIIFGILLIISGWIVLSTKKAFLTIPWKLMWQPYWILATLVIIAIAWAAGKKWRVTRQIPWGLIGAAVAVVAIIIFLNWDRDDPPKTASFAQTSSQAETRKAVTSEECGHTRTPTDSIVRVIANRKGHKLKNFRQYRAVFWERTRDDLEYVVRYPTQEGVDSVVYTVGPGHKELPPYLEWVEIASTSDTPVPMKVIYCL